MHTSTCLYTWMHDSLVFLPSKRQPETRTPNIARNRMQKQVSRSLCSMRTVQKNRVEGLRFRLITYYNML